MGKKLSANQWQKQQKALEKRKSQAAARGAARFDDFGGEYTKVTYEDLAKIQGFGTLQPYQLSESDSKYLRYTTTGWQVILDLSRTYFRVQNPDEEYVGADGTTKRVNESADDFLGRSHFKTK